MTYTSINDRINDASPLVTDPIGSDNNGLDETSPPQLEESGSVSTLVVEQPTQQVKKKRILSLDILRGISVIMMIVVNNQPGDAYWWLQETCDPSWIGVHPGDFIFAFFLFVMGYAMGIVFSRKVPRPEKIERRWCCCCIPISIKNKIYFPTVKWIRIFRRSLLLIILGVGENFLETLPYDMKYTRWSCTLCRIAVVYFITCSIMNLFTWMFTQICVVATLHVIYILIMYCYPVPGCGRGNISKECSAQGYFDQMILGRNHMWMQKPYDPEGIVSTLPTITTVYFGVVYYKISEYVKRNHKNDKYVLLTLWMFLSTVLILISLILNYNFVPYIKEIWNTPWVFLAAGSAGVLLSFIMWIVDIHGISFWAPLFVWTGINPLFMYVVPQYVGGLFDIIKLNGVDGLDTYLWRYLLQSWIKNEKFSSLIWGIIFESVYIPFAWFLYWRKIYIKL